MSMWVKGANANHPLFHVSLVLGIGLIAHDQATASMSQRTQPVAPNLPRDAPPAAAGATITVETRDISVRVPEALRRDVGTLVVVETDSSPLSCEGAECALKTSNKSKSQKLRGVVASTDEAEKEVDLFPFECSSEGCNVGAESLAAVKSEAFAEATKRASDAKSQLKLMSGEPVRAMKAPEVIRGVKLRLFFEAVVQAKQACIRATVPSAIFRKQEWGEDLPNSIIVTYRQALPDQGFAHELRADLFFVMAFPIEQFETKLAGETFEFHVESLFASHRVHVATGAHLRGFSLESSQDYRFFYDVVNNCLSSP